MLKLDQPLLLFDGECGVCRHIAHWVQQLARGKSGEITLLERPIGDDPDALRLLHPDLDIWDAYATIHLLMPDGSMKLGGEAVAEVLRALPATKWLARSFAVSILGFRPFQAFINIAYVILADVRPLFGCESCGTGNVWMKPVLWVARSVKNVFSDRHHPRPVSNFTSFPRPVRRGAHP